MLKIFNSSRYYCKAAAKIDFKKLKFKSKVPSKPIPNNFIDSTDNSVEIDSKTIQLLERLSLVNLDSKDALDTIQKSVQFANKIVSINTDNIKPLYTVLELENLYLRKDEIQEENNRKDILKNAKLTDEDYFVAPPGNIPLEQDTKKFSTDL